MSDDAEETNDRPGERGTGGFGGSGGDPACWLDQVCDACGRIRERPGSAVCEHCGAGAGSAPAPTAATPPRAPGRPAVRRDRDEQGRARSARPRDGLGRPLPYGSPGVARQPEGVPRTPAESLAEAQRLLDAGMPFHAHEVLEDAWKAAPEPEREMWRGLAQLAVGLTHAARGNASGATALLDRGTAAITPYADAAPYGIDITGLADWAGELTGRLSERPREPVPAAKTAPRLRGTDGRADPGPATDATDS
ncbi:DUF309 domain-containing protein [Streptomyces sp. NPDC050636]|uniref:DUF309 domain-containing protein n=1 Tax=Streptomyces sp. NPDC050636 TaxID=3154510 RepID=UPI003445834C